MSLDVVETIKSTFNQFKTGVGLKLLGAFIGISLLGTGLTTAVSSASSTAVTSLVAVGGLLIGLASIVLYIGGFRSLYNRELKKSYFTQDLVMPFLRNTGSGIILGAFAFLGAYLAVIPAILIGGGAAAFSTSSLLTSLSPSLIVAIGLIAGAFALYPILALATSSPMIFIERNRMFEALDKSVQRSKGEKLGMFFALLPVALLYIVSQLTTWVGFSGSSVSAMSPAAMVVSSILSSVTSVASISLLVEYHKNLPEA